MGGILSGNMLKLNSNIVSWVGVKMELRIATPKDIAVIQQLRIKMLGSCRRSAGEPAPSHF